MEQIFDFLSNTLGYTSIGLHGQSIGGIFAVHAAAHFQQCKFLLVDRGFSSFANVAYWTTMTHFVYWIFNFFPAWNLNQCNKFINTHCYKVIANDSRDAIVPWQSSLAQGIIDQLIIQRTTNLSLPPLQRKKYIISNFLTKQFKFAQTICCVAFNGQQMINKYIYNELCPLVELNKLLFALQRLVGVIVQMSQLKREKRKKATKHFRAHSNEMPELYYNDKQHIKKTTQESNSLDSSFAQGFRDMKDSSLKELQLTEEDFQKKTDLQQIISEEQIQKILQYKENEALAAEIIVSEEDVSCETFMNLILEVFYYQIQIIQQQIYGILDLIDSCGLLLTEIVLNFKSQHLEILKVILAFLKGLEFYGSYLPIKVIYKNNLTLQMNQKMTLVFQKFTYICLKNKLNDFVTKAQNVIMNQLNLSKTNAHLNVLKDLNTICTIFSNINAKLQISFKERAGQPEIVHMPSQDINNLNDSITNDQPSINLKEVEHNKLLNQSNLSSSPQQVVKLKRKYSENQLSQYFGNFLPLQCGHNGAYNHKESKLLEYHLKCAEFIKNTQTE